MSILYAAPLFKEDHTTNAPVFLDSPVPLGRLPTLRSPLAVALTIDGASGHKGPSCNPLSVFGNCMFSF